MSDDRTDERKPEIVGPALVPEKVLEIRDAIGKTIASIEFGVVANPYPDWVHEGEALVLHFTDGTALSIEIGSNIRNLADANKYGDLKPGDLHTDLITMWRRRTPPGDVEWHVR